MPDLPYLKKVSRLKHRILSDYLAAWTSILGSRHPRLGYVDCFAGGGIYRDEKDQPLRGSPLIALEVARSYARQRSGRSLFLGFVEEDHDIAERLRDLLGEVTDLPQSVKYSVYEEDAQDFIQRLISQVEESKTGQIIPAFFFVDPYGHPISVPVMRDLLRLGKTEILVNLMWWNMAMHLENPQEETSIDQLFGHTQWRSQTFRPLRGRPKERAFVQYFTAEVGAQYALPFAIPFSPEDQVPGGGGRTKFYLIHFSNHPKAALLMKEVMWSARKDLDEVLLGEQLRLFGVDPDLNDLRQQLLERFHGEEVSFDDIRVQTLQWPYIEAHYREVLKSIDGKDVRIHRVESKKTGLKGRDEIVFL